ncbi:MAG: sensor histidine kinase [Acidimicrobiia bacterium]
MSELESQALIRALRRRLERERKARLEAESIAESVTREIYVLNQIKTEFIATVSHELRTPLTALIGFAETLKREEIADDAQIRADVIERMGRQLRRLHRLIEQLLSTNLLQSPEMEFAPNTVEFADLASEIISDTDFGSLNVELGIPDGLPTLLTDPNMIGTIFGNLIDNAVKFSPDGGTVTIGARAERTSFIFWVHDEGIGMQAEEIARAFEPFWQADASSTRKFGGVGLGLHLVRLITQLLGGEVTIESEKGKGTKVTVTLRSVVGRTAATAGF